MSQSSLSLKIQHLISSLFTLLIGILPFVFCWLSDELFEFNKMLLVYSFAIIITALFFTRMVLEKRLIWQKTIFDWPIGLFLLSQIVTTIISLHPRTSLLGYYTRLNGGLLSTLAYVSLYYAFVNNVSRQNRRPFLISAFLGSILVSLYAIFEHFGRSFSCLIIKGDFNVACWVQDVQTRVFATFGQPNWLAAYNVTLIGLGTALLFQQLAHPAKTKSTLYPIILALSVYLNFAALLFTKSRSGILAFTAGLIFTILAFIFAWWHQRTLTKRNFAYLSLLVSGFFLLGLIFGTPYTPTFQNLFPQLQAQTSSIPLELPTHLQHLNLQITDSADIRKIVWRGALSIAKAHPFLGTGVETFAYSYYNHRPADHNWTSEWDFLYNKAHNELLNYLANSGLFGLLTYLSIFFVLGISLLKFLSLKPQPRAYLSRSSYLIGITAGLLALSITNFFGFSTVTVQVLLFIFLALAAQIYHDFSLAAPAVSPATGGATHTPKRLHPWQITTLSLVTITTLFLLTQVWYTWYADYNYAKCKSTLGKISLDQSINYCLQAIKLRPQEALYQGDLADFYAQYAVALAKSNPTAPEIAAFANQALQLSNRVLELNPLNLNFYKTRFRTLTNLAVLDLQALQLAKTTLDAALILSPTDPKLAYYYSTLLDVLGDPDGAQTWLDKSLELRPIYYDARLKQAQKAAASGDIPTAIANYQFILDHIDPASTPATQGIATLATLSASPANP